MLGTHDLWAFVAAALLLTITPGPDTLYVLTRTIARGHRDGLQSVAGICSGLVIHITLAAFGLSAILATSATAFAIVKYAGAAYLIYLGIRALRRPSTLPLGGPEDEGAGGIPLAVAERRSAYWQGALTNALNPKVAVFFLAFMPQFVVANAGLGAVPFLFLGLIFAVFGIFWLLLVVAGAAGVARFFRSNQKAGVLLERMTGVAFIALGLNLLRAKPQPA